MRPDKDLFTSKVLPKVFLSPCGGFFYNPFASGITISSQRMNKKYIYCTHLTSQLNCVKAFIQKSPLVFLECERW